MHGYIKQTMESIGLIWYMDMIFLRYLSVFDEIRLVAHTRKCETKEQNMLRVDGKNLSVYEVPFPHGKLQYIKMYKNN